MCQACEFQSMKFCDERDRYKHSMSQRVYSLPENMCINLLITRVMAVIKGKYDMPGKHITEKEPVCTGTYYYSPMHGG